MNIKELYTNIRFNNRNKTASDALTLAREYEAKKVSVYKNYSETKDYFRFVSNVQSDCGYRNGYFTDGDIKGWYTDEFYDDNLAGAIYQCTGKNGLSRFVIGTIHSDSEYVNISLNRIYSVRIECENDLTSSYHDDMRNIAIRVDNRARRKAEEMREYDEAWRMGSQCYDESEIIKEHRKEIKEIIPEMRKIDKTSKIYDVLHNALCDHVKSIRTCKDKIEELRNEAEYLNKEAFKEGFGVIS